MSDEQTRFVVITGGPGSGKSALIGALERAGHRSSPEVGRTIIQAQIAIAGPGLPWIDPPLFAEMMLSWEMQSYHREAAEPGRVYFDRGIPDVIGYLRLVGRPVPAHMTRAAERFRYNRRVFIAPPWPEIFEQDRERRQTLEEAARTYAAMVATYTELGYELVELPRAPVAARVDFILGSGVVGR